MRYMRRVYGREGPAGRGRRTAIASVALAMVVASWGLAAAEPPSTRPTSAATTAPSPASAPADVKSISKLPLRTEKSDKPLRLSDEDGIRYGQMLAYLLVVVVLGLVAIIAAKRLLPRLNPAAGGRRIRVVDSAYVGPRKQVLVIQVGPRKFLVGSCRDSLTLLSEITDTFSDIYESKRASADGGAGDPAAPEEADT